MSNKKNNTRNTNHFGEFVDEVNELINKTLENRPLHIGSIIGGLHLITRDLELRVLNKPEKQGKAIEVIKAFPKFS